MAAAPLNAFCKFANATAAAAQPLPREASQESESESESPHDLAARVAWRAGAMAVAHTRRDCAPPRGGGKATALKRFLASQSFLLLCEFCAKVHQGGGRDGKPAAHSTVAVHRRWHSRQATRCAAGDSLAQKWRALQFQAQHEFATSSVHCAKPAQQQRQLSLST